ncbi:MAG: CRTAC1 family protein, partial [Deltaproteobacteria bacterium]
FRNRGDGTFEDVAAAARVDLAGVDSSGPIFADIDGDGWLDLLVLANVAGGDGLPLRLFQNQGNGRFANRTSATGLHFTRATSFSAALADIDRDGDLDLFVTHWGSFGIEPPAEMLWRNEGNFVFTDITAEAGFGYRFHPQMSGLDWTFTPNFADINSDGWPDLLLANDFGTSQIFLNDGDGTFTETTSPVIDDENGMGAAVGDYDNDGDLDWFVTSISDPLGIQEDNDAVGDSGNRLYQNQGDGTFVDVTDTAGVRDGDWGWGASFGDLNLDGWLDLYMVNGMGQIEDGPGWEYFIADPAKLWVSEGDGSFLERGVSLGVADSRMGRGTVFFDLDRDGDLDIFNQNVADESVLYRNDLTDGAHFLVLRLIGEGANREGIGARVRVSTGGTTQMRELRNGSGFVSASAVEAHFGLGAAEIVDTLEIIWPNGTTTVVEDIPVDGHYFARYPGATVEDCSQPGDANPCVLGGRIRSPMECLLEMHVTPPPPKGRRGGPGSRIRCRAGDPECDADPLDLTSCSIDLRLCPATRDPRNFICSAPDLTSIVIQSPRRAAPGRADRAMREGAEALLGNGLASLLPHEDSPFVNLTPGRCTSATRVTLPLRERSAGVYRKSRTRLKMITRSADGRRDVDDLVVRCSPAAS